MITLGTDVADLILQRTLYDNTLGLNSSIERMTSGYKVNRAKDNAAGFSIITDLNTQISSMLQVQQNAGDGIAMLQTAEGGLEEIEELLQRLRSLAVQASDGAYGETSREAMQAEADEIIAQIEQIRDSMEYNGLNLYETPQPENVVTTSLNNMAATARINNKQITNNIHIQPQSGTEFQGNAVPDFSLKNSSPSLLSAGTIEGAEDFRANEKRVITIDGVEYTVTNLQSTAASLSYIKDTASGELTFIGNKFKIEGQSDVVHNLIINGTYNDVYGGDLADKIQILDSSSRYNDLYGGAGDDTFIVNAGYGNIYGGDGNDTFITNTSKINVYGEAGNDIFDANNCGTFYGGAGDDSFTIKTSSAIFNGDDGEDSFNIVSGFGNTVNGGAGTNSIIDNGTGTISTNVPGATKTSVSFVTGETKSLTINGIDYEITCESKAGDLMYSVDTSTGQITFNSNKGNWVIRGDKNKAHNVRLEVSDTSFYGSDFADTIVSTKNSNIIYSYEGNDNITIANYSTIYTGDGDNNITLNGSYAIIYTGNGNDVITSTLSNSFNNYIDMGGGDNTLNIKGTIKHSGIYGGSGNNNTLNGTIENSLVAGFDDSVNNAEYQLMPIDDAETFVIGGKEYTLQTLSSYTKPIAYKSFLYSYNDVTDTVSFAVNNISITSQADVSHNIHIYGKRVNLYGGDLDDTITVDCYTAYVYGNAGNDTIIHNTGGDSRMYGGDGDDTIIENSSATIYGQAGNDTITINTYTPYTMDGGDGDDVFNINANVTVTDTGGNNIYNINTDNASVTGGSGNDTFYISGDNNTVSGAAGDDYFVIDGANNVIDGGTGNNYYIDNGTGTSMSNVNNDPNSGGLSFTYQGEKQTFTLGGKTYTVTNNIAGSNTLKFSLNPNTGVITVNGSNFGIDAELNESAVLNIRGDNNVISGSDLADLITIEQGSNNTVNALGGNDTLIMNSENNSLSGGAGNDSITLNASTNLAVTGGEGNNTFNISSSNNTNIETGDGNNKITLSGSQNIVHAGEGANNITINSASNTVTTGDGNNRFVINGSQNTVSAGSGDNILGVQGDSNNLNFGNLSGNINIYGDNNTVVNTRGENDVVIRGDGNSYSTILGNKDISVTGNNNELLTGSGNDKIEIRGDGNQIETASGENEITVRGDGNSVQGGAGIDDISVNGNNNTAFGGDANDSIMVAGGTGNTIDGEGGDRNTIINNGSATSFTNAVDITPRPFEVNIKVDIGSGDDKFISTKISFNLFDFSVDFMSQEGALDSLESIDDMIKTVQEQLLNIGTTINRLENAAEAQSLKLNNLISSRSTLRDADIAEESSSFIRYQILQQASAVLMASSRNLRAENVLGLLRGINIAG